jgi:hypothetical protein
MVGKSAGAATSGDCTPCQAGTYWTGTGGQALRRSSLSRYLDMIGPTGKFVCTAVSNLSCAAVPCADSV